MIRFRILGGGYIDLLSDFEFSFNYNNGLFAFEKMQLNRSGEFSIPRTPHNDIQLGFSHDPSNDGRYIRKSIPAELYYSGGKIEGALFVGKYTDGSRYSAVFVYGELFALKRIQEMSTIDTYIVTNEHKSISNSTLVNAYSPTGYFNSNFDFYRYKNGVPDASKQVSYFNQFPTVKLSYLVQEAAFGANVNVNTDGIGQAVDAVGLILANNNSTEAYQTVSVSGAANLSLSASGTGATNFDMETRLFTYYDYYSSKPTFKKTLVRVFVCKRDVTLIMTVDSYNTAIVSGDGFTYLTNWGANFKSMKVGQKIELKKGDYFTFIHLSDTFIGTPVSDYSTPIVSGISFDMYVGTLELADVGDEYYLSQNLPKVTLIDLVKVLANLFRCGITYDGVTNTIGFFDFNFNKASAKVIDDIVIDVKSVNRVFFDYAQKNYIKFKNEEYVLNSVASTIYTIDNENLANEKTLYTIPFSEGIRDEFNDVVVNDFELSAPYKKTAKIETLVVPSVVNGENSLKHISMLYQYLDTIMQGSDNLTPIIRNSTTVEMTVKMTAMDFLNIKNTDVFRYRGKYYVCIFGTHSGQIAELTLIKI
jgi:hypothetical protein